MLPTPNRTTSITDYMQNFCIISFLSQFFISTGVIPLLFEVQKLNKGWMVENEAVLEETAFGNKIRQKIQNINKPCTVYFSKFCFLNKAVRQIFAQQLHQISYQKQSRNDLTYTRGCARATCKQQAFDKELEIARIWVSGTNLLWLSKDPFY